LKFGLCCEFSEFPAALKAGFDYVEGSLSGLAMAPSLGAYRSIPMQATNLFFPGSIRLFGEDRTPYFDYAEGALERAGELGVKIAVLGSGAVRRAPEAEELEEYEDAFAEIASELADAAEGFGVTLAPESLNRSETNVGNDLAALAKRLVKRGVAYTADSYHILYEWKARNPGQDVPRDSLWEVQMPFAPAHVHVATLPRVAPTPGDPKLVGFVARLRELGYDGRVSLECQRGNAVEELADALKNLKSLFGA
jgi:D-psicose/D-tagatose/L-ribulose 3-epimerase